MGEVGLGSARIHATTAATSREGRAAAQTVRAPPANLSLSLSLSRELNRVGAGRAHSPGFCRLVRHAPESSVVTFGRRNWVGQGWVRDWQQITVGASTCKAKE